MGLFSRKQQKAAPPRTAAAASPSAQRAAPSAPPADPPAKSALPTTTLSHARKVIDALGKAWGNDQLMHQAMQQLLHTTDATEQDLFRALDQGVEPEEFLQRPWRWFSGIAQRANAEGDPQLAALAFGFIYEWTTKVEPAMTPQMRFANGFGLVPREVVLSLAQEAVTASDTLADTLSPDGARAAAKMKATAQRVLNG